MKQPAPHAERPDLSNRKLRFGLLLLSIGLGLYLVAKPYLGADWHRPGSALLQSMAIIGALLLLAPFLFSLGKRGGMSAVPNRLFILHVGASLAGVAFVAPHALAHFDGPPLWLVAALVIVIATGVVGRVFAATLFAASFAMKPAAFASHDAEKKAALQDLINAKRDVLSRLDPLANEALFSVTLAHWFRHPVHAFHYARLASREAQLVQNRQSLSRLASYWRPLHMLVAWLFLAGLIIHIIVVTFFAGYVAEGREIYWWHITAW